MGEGIIITGIMVPGSLGTLSVSVSASCLRGSRQLRGAVLAVSAAMLTAVVSGVAGMVTLRDQQQQQRQHQGLAERKVNA
jgi:hypothetical protein